MTEEEGGVELKGKLSEMGLSDIVQVVCKGRNQVCLIVQSQGQEGSLFFEDGQIVHAVLNSHEGEEVIYELLTWEDGTFEIKQEATPPKRTITANWQSLLLEGMRRLDEQDPRLRETASKTFEDAEVAVANNYGDRHRTHGTKKSKREVAKMDTNKLDEAIEVMKKDMKGGLIATDIWTVADGQSLGGFNTQPKAVALFNELTSNLIASLKGSDFPALGRFYVVDLVGGIMACVIPLGEYQWGLLLDSTKAPLGLLLNVAIPNAIDRFEEAIAA
jgi:hypothetical protein